MAIEIYHQIGANMVWNLSSIKDDRTGDGVIFSPRHDPRDRIVNLQNLVRRSAIFDPQFYLPSSPRGQLSTYAFFPDLIAENGFETNDYTTDIAVAGAINCVNFQVQNNFRYIVIPSWYYRDMRTDYIERQKSLFVEPFLQACRDLGVQKEIVLQLVLTDGMVKDIDYSNEILNWVTQYDEIAGVYLIVEAKPRRKQLKTHIDFLYRYLHFCAYPFC